MGNLVDALHDHASDRVFLSAVKTLLDAHFRSFIDQAPTTVVEERDGERTLTLAEPWSPYRWRFWPDADAGGWLAEFQNTIADDDDNWTPIFASSERDVALRLDASADDVALWIASLTSPEV